MHELPPTYGRSRVDLWVLAMLVELVAGGGLGLVFGRGCTPDAQAAPPKEPPAASTLHVS